MRGDFDEDEEDDGVGSFERCPACGADVSEPHEEWCPENGYDEDEA